MEYHSQTSVSQWKLWFLVFWSFGWLFNFTTHYTRFLTLYYVINSLARLEYLNSNPFTVNNSVLLDCTYSKHIYCTIKFIKEFFLYIVKYHCFFIFYLDLNLFQSHSNTLGIINQFVKCVIIFLNWKGSFWDILNLNFKIKFKKQ